MVVSEIAMSTSLSIGGCVVPRHCSHKAIYIYVEVVVVRKLILKALPAETIESMN
jgi:hypothetical protein